MNTQIVFYSVRDTPDKLTKLCAIAQRHFESGDPLLIMTSDEKARDFVDELLWRLPADSFLPHAATDMPCRDTIAITCGRQNTNGARSIFNLTSEPLFLENLTIYEFDERSTPQRSQASEARFRAYRDRNLPIRMETF